MYKTIEAQIENGQIKSLESEEIPSIAHVLITFLDKKEKVSEAKKSSSLRGALKAFSDKSLMTSEETAWLNESSQKYEAH